MAALIGGWLALNAVLLAGLGVVAYLRRKEPVEVQE